MSLAIEQTLQKLEDWAVAEGFVCPVCRTAQLDEHEKRCAECYQTQTERYGE